MSAQFKNIKKTASQAKLRHLFNEHKSKQTVVKKIDSPLAKYNDLGQLTCVLCQFVVRSENVWPVHINSKQHREKVEKAKALKEKLTNFSTPQKRPLTPPSEVPTKKLKGILKNAGTNSNQTIVDVEKEAISSDGTNVENEKLASTNELNETSSMEVDVANSSATIPEGFFDDPKQDAKARHIDYKDPIEEEWEKFQRAIRDADNESAAIIAEDQEEATTERQIDEIDEQLKNWSRVVSLERKKTEVIPVVNKESMQLEDDDISENEDNLDEYLDWRSKSFKL